MQKRFLILGGTGFIGSHLCDALLSAGHTVRLFNRLGRPLYRKFAEHEQVELMSGDFYSTADVEQAVLGCHVIFHLISTTLPKSSNDDPIYDVESNVIATLRLLNAARHSGVEKIVFVSSGGTVYGVPRSVPISETHPTNPVCSYGIGKLTIEKYLHLYKILHGLNYCILRLANPFGERQRVNAAQGAVAVFMNRAIHNLPIEIWGDGSVVRDYIYITDIADALVKAAFYSGKERLFNIGSGNGKSLNDILAEIEGLLDRPVARTYLPGRVFDVPANVLDIVHAQKHLAWSPQVSFKEGLARTLRWLENPHGKD
ncbi:MAG: NAD-dependent epimerase [Deltaproteobacteria bacterium RIFOXYD12_FULL_50_9]|nr:MAG: NAD-dependent epimerase [Deltaproteobacteria bacterium RIFOXYD12_FULL_50_9]